MKEYVLISLKHTDFTEKCPRFVFWKDDFCGYTTDLGKAGRYNRNDLFDHYNNPSWATLLETKFSRSELEKFDTIVVKTNDLEKLGLISMNIVTF